MNRTQQAAWQDFFRLLLTAAANADLYNTAHPQVAALGNKAHALLTSLIDRTAELKILLIDGNIVLNDRPLAASLHATRFVKAMNIRGIEHIAVKGSVTAQEVRHLILLLCKGQDQPQTAQNSCNVRFGSIDMNSAGGQKANGFASPSGESDLLRCDRDKLAEICSGATKNRPLSVAGMREIVSHFLQALDQELNPLLAIFPLQQQDQYSFTHSTNVCLLMLAHARKLGLDGPLLHDIGIAALLHDIGKLFLPVDLINKPGKPTDEEWALIRQHPERGAAYLIGTPGVPQLAVVTAYEHHLKYNMTGYPRPQNAWRQHLCSHMTTIADIFDALRTKRSYRDAVEARRVAAMLTEIAGSELHPQLTTSFLQMIDEATPAAIVPTP